MNKIEKPVMAQKEADVLKKYYFLDAVSIFLAVSLVVLAWALSYLLFVVILKSNPSAAFFNSDASDKTIYILSAFFIPAFFLAFRSAADKFSDKISGARYNLLAQIAAGLTAAVVIILTIKVFGLKMRDSEYNYIYGTELHLHPLVFVPIACLFSLVFFTAFVDEIKSVISRIKMKYFGYFLDFLAIIIIVGASYEKFTVVGAPGNLNAFFYSITQIMNGRAALVDFPVQYGLYGHFLEPIFRLMGNEQLWNLEFVMHSLICACFILIYYFLRGVLKNRLLAFIAAMSVFFYSYVAFAVDFAGAEYFQYLPLRVIVPVLLLFLGAIYFKNRKTSLYYVITVLLSFGILWNPDTGIMALFSWGAALVFSDIQKYIKTRDFYKSVLRQFAFHALNFAVIAVLAFVIFGALVFLRRGIFPNFMELLKYQQMFYFNDFLSIKMPLFHQWNLAAVMIAAGFAVSLGGLFRKKSDMSSYMHTVMFLVSALGVTIFAYYNGRSHDHCLIPVLYAPLIIAAMLADNILYETETMLRDQTYIPGRMLSFILIIVFFAAPLPNLFKHLMKSSPSGFFAKLTPAFRTGYSYHRFLKPYFKKGEQVYVISFNQACIYADTGAVNPLKIPGSWEFGVDESKYIDIVKKYLRDPGNGGKTIIWDRTDGGEYVNHFQMQFSSLYTLDGVFPGTLVEVYEKYPENEVPELLFDNAGSLLHVKQRKGLVYTMIDKTGKPGPNFIGNTNKYLKTAGRFSVQAVVIPTDDEFKNVQMIGNNCDLSGFRIAASQKKNYYKIFCGSGTELKESPEFYLEPWKWAYIVMNYDNGKVSFYENNKLLFDLDAVISSAIEPFRMPELNGGFKGGIYELKIGGDIVTPEQMNETFGVVAPKLGIRTGKK